MGSGSMTNCIKYMCSLAKGTYMSRSLLQKSPNTAYHMIMMILLCTQLYICIKWCDHNMVMSSCLPLLIELQYPISLTSQKNRITTISYNYVGTKKPYVVLMILFMQYKRLSITHSKWAHMTIATSLFFKYIDILIDAQLCYMYIQQLQIRQQLHS